MFHKVHDTFQFDKELDPIFTQNIFALQHDDWRNTRTELSPAFTQSKVSMHGNYFHFEKVLI